MAIFRPSLAFIVIVVHNIAAICILLAYGGGCRVNSANSICRAESTTFLESWNVGVFFSPSCTALSGVRPSFWLSSCGKANAVIYRVVVAAVSYAAVCHDDSITWYAVLLLLLLLQLYR